VYQSHTHGPHTLEDDLYNGRYEPEIPYDGRQCLRRQWDKIVPNELLSQKDNYWAQLTQHIMEGRHLAYDTDTITQWTAWVNGARFGEYIDLKTGRFNVSKEQESIAAETIHDAQLWYKQLALPHRLRRLRPQGSLYNQVQLFTRGRAPWPTKQLGPLPNGDKYTRIVRKFCLRNHSNYPKMSPKSAISEYTLWWKNNSSSYTPKVQQFGNEVLAKTHRLLNKLGQIKANSELAKKLLQYSLNTKTFNNWPYALLSYHPESQLEKDCFHDWLFCSENKIRSYLTPEHNSQKYSY